MAVEAVIACGNGMDAGAKGVFRFRRPKQELRALLPGLMLAPARRKTRFPRERNIAMRDTWT